MGTAVNKIELGSGILSCENFLGNAPNDLPEIYIHDVTKNILRRENETDIDLYKRISGNPSATSSNFKTPANNKTELIFDDIFRITPNPDDTR